MSTSSLNHWTSLVDHAQEYSPVYHIGPQRRTSFLDWQSAIAGTLKDPIGMAPLSSQVDADADVVILVDDDTRPTPQNKILPVLLDCLNQADVPDEHITILIALGTHRYMTRAEMRQRFGESVCARADVKNHTWRDRTVLVKVGRLNERCDLILNRTAVEADFLIGVGSIVPHIWAGWGGGAKIVLPGISSADSIAPTHAMAEHEADLLQISGNADNKCRHQIERAAQQAGLDMIVNCVIDTDKNPVWIGAGDPVKAHREGVVVAEDLFVHSVPALMDVLLADARPAIKDYWQGVKALAHAARAVQEGGVIIFSGEFPHGISSTHTEFSQHSTRSPDQIADLDNKGAIEDSVIVTTLKLHTTICQRYQVVCLSDGLSPADKRMLGFYHAEDPSDALDQAVSLSSSPAPSLGIIDYAGNVLADN